jgi:hypothetical protein
MNKSVAIFVSILFLLCATIGFLVWQLFSKDDSGSLSSLISSSVSISGSSVKSGELPEQSLVPALPDSTIMAFALEPRRFDPLGAHVTKVRERLAATALWKKAGLDQLVEQYLNSDMKEIAQGALASAGDAAALAAAGLPPLSPAQLGALLSEEWTRLEEILFASDGVTFSPLPGVNAPRSLLAVTFRDEESRKRVQELLISQAFGDQTELPLDEITLKKVGDDRIEIYSAFLDSVFRDSMAEFGAPEGGAESPKKGPFGVIEFEGARAFVSLGVNSAKEMLPASAGGTSEAPTLSSGPRWAEIKNGIVPEAAFFVFYDLEKFASFFDQIMGAMAGFSENAGSGSMPILPRGMFNWSVASVHVADGVGVRQCARLKPGSDISRPYRQALETASQGAAGKLLKIVDQNTIVGLNVSRWLLDIYSASARMMRVAQKEATPGTTDAGQSAALDAEWEKYHQTIEALGKLYKRRGFEHLGVVLSGPRPEQVAMLMGGPAGPKFVPDTGIMLEFSSSVSNADVAQLFNDSALLLLGDNSIVPLPVAAVAKGRALADGSLPFPEVVRLSFGDTLQFVGAAAEPTVFLLAKDEVQLDSLKRRLTSTTPFITREALAGRELDSQLASSGAFALISTSSLIELARGFVPMGLMMAPPELQIGMPEVDELLDILTLKLIAVSNGAMFGDDLYCSDTRAVAL